MTDQALDDLARRVMLDVACQEYGDLIDELPEHDFSPKFEKKMQKLIRRANHPIRHWVIQAAACLLLAALLSGCAVLAISPEAREAFVGWVREVYETYALYRFIEEEEKNSLFEADIIYQPAYVPSGYQIEHRTVLSNGLVRIIYINDQINQLAIFTCFPDTGSSTILVEWDSEDIYKEVYVNGISADLYLDADEGDSNVLVWVDKDIDAGFCISGAFGEEELIKIAESVQVMPRYVFFRPLWLPEGYYEVSAEDWPTGEDTSPHNSELGQSVLSYKDGKGGLLTITYAHDFADRDLHPDSNGANVVSTFVGNAPAFLYLDQAEDNTNHLVWVDGDTGVLFRISGSLAGDELIRIAESMEVSEELIAMAESVNTTQTSNNEEVIP